MKNLTLTLLCAGLISTSAIAKESCFVFYEAQNYQQSAECYVQQLKKERTFNNLEHTGYSYYNLGRYKEALPYLKEAEKKVANAKDLSVLYSYLGSTYSALNDKVEELAYHMKSLELSLKSKDKPENIGTTYNNIGVYYKKQNQLTKALEYYSEALKYQQEIQRAYTYGNMGDAYYYAEEDKKAEEMYLKAINIDEKTGKYKDVAYHKGKLGLLYFTQNRYNEARIIFEDARIISHKTNQISSESYALSFIARIDYEEGKTSDAKNKAMEALLLAKQSGNSGLLSSANETWNIVNGK